MHLQGTDDLTDRHQKLGWFDPGHAAQWTATLTTYAFPVIGKRHPACRHGAHVAKPKTIYARLAILHHHAMNDVSSPSSEVLCRICMSADLKAIIVNEMMFGTRRPFEYLECDSCGCIQIAKYPPDISDHYPDNYYSLQEEGKIQSAPISIMKSKIKRLAFGVPMLHKSWITSAGTQRWIDERPVVKAMVDQAPNTSTRILDVGCGAGHLLKLLDWLGYRDLHGADPFVKGDVLHRGKLLVRKTFLADVEGSFELISLHHTLEHMPDQRRVLQDLRRLLAPGGKLLIRIPVSGGEAWRHYRENWVQLDAPRHYYIHSRQSITMVAEQSGFRLTQTIDDSTGFQFWGSELYLRGIPLIDATNTSRTHQSYFSQHEWQQFEQRAARVNQAGDGDQIIAVFERA